MVDEMLTELNIVHRETRFTKKPSADVYAVWMEDVEASGSDDRNGIYEHQYTIELYSYTPARTEENAIETYLDTSGIPYDKQARYWIQDEQLYQVIYEFTITNKTR